MTSQFASVRVCCTCFFVESVVTARQPCDGSFEGGGERLHHDCCSYIFRIRLSATVENSNSSRRAATKELPSPASLARTMARPPLIQSTTGRRRGSAER